MKRTLIYMVAAASVIIGMMTLLAFRYSAGEAAPPSPKGEYRAAVAYWEQAFKNSPDGAYMKYVGVGSALSYNEAHILAHIVGRILYEQFGLSGIRRCTTDFAFGCYHGFASVALMERGLSTLPELRDACDGSGSAFTAFGCIHGIGHGSLAYLGNEHIAQALESCVPLNGDAVVGGCFGGVFMEYNYRTMAATSTGISLRPYDSAQPYEPCSTEVPKQFRDACYYDQPSWWKSTFEIQTDMSEEERYREVGRLCNAIPGAAHRPFCFKGVGNIIGPESGYRAEDMKRLCSFMPDTQSVGWCYQEALNHLLQSEKGKSQLRSLCESGEITYEDFCKEL